MAITSKDLQTFFDYNYSVLYDIINKNISFKDLQRDESWNMPGIYGSIAVKIINDMIASNRIIRNSWYKITDSRHYNNTDNWFKNNNSLLQYIILKIIDKCTYMQNLAADHKLNNAIDVDNVIENHFIALKYYITKIFGISKNADKTSSMNVQSRIYKLITDNFRVFYYNDLIDLHQCFASEDFNGNAMICMLHNCFLTKTMSVSTDMFNVVNDIHGYVHSIANSDNSSKPNRIFCIAKGCVYNLLNSFQKNSKFDKIEKSNIAYLTEMLRLYSVFKILAMDYSDSNFNAAQRKAIDEFINNCIDENEYSNINTLKKPYNHVNKIYNIIEMICELFNNPVFNDISFTKDFTKVYVDCLCCLLSNKKRLIKSFDKNIVNQIKGKQKDVFTIMANKKKVFDKLKMFADFKTQINNLNIQCEDEIHKLQNTYKNMVDEANTQFINKIEAQFVNK